MIALGAEVAIEPGAGVKSGILDADYTGAGATVAKVRSPALGHRLKAQRVRRLRLGWREAQGLRHRHHGSVRQRSSARAMAKAGVTAFAMELMPRITRAQTMDVLSSQANLAGYGP